MAIEALCCQLKGKKVLANVIFLVDFWFLMSEAKVKQKLKLKIHLCPVALSKYFLCGAILIMTWMQLKTSLFLCVSLPPLARSPARSPAQSRGGAGATVNRSTEDLRMKQQQSASYGRLRECLSVCLTVPHFFGYGHSVVISNLFETVII